MIRSAVILYSILPQPILLDVRLSG